MSTYKLIQDIEAEDHILGPLTLKQFLFGLGAAFLWYLCFIGIAKHLTIMVAMFILPALFCTFFAFPFHGDQPTEVWAIAKLRFIFKPRQRIWDQAAQKEVVTVTVPKKVEIVRSDGLSQIDVTSRLKALANTLDSRGWAVKNVSADAYRQPYGVSNNTERLLGLSDVQEVPNYDVTAREDVLDDTGNNPIAQQFDQMINASTVAHRQELIQKMNAASTEQPAPSAPMWFANQQTATVETPDEAALSAALKARSQTKQMVYESHLRTIQPLGEGGAPEAQTAVDTTPPAADPAQTWDDTQTAPATDQTTTDDQAQNGQAQAVTAAPDPAILSLANNNDLNVATLAREAYKAKHDGLSSGDEVVISLH